MKKKKYLKKKKIIINVKMVAIGIDLGTTYLCWSMERQSL